MNLFVDSNIYLNFYHFSNDDLEELKKLSELIQREEVTLYVTQQVIDEVNRNRDVKVADAYKKFKTSKLEFSLPQICKQYSEYRAIKKTLVELRKVKSELDEKLDSDISGKTLRADQVIKELFGLAKTIDSREFIDEARQRYHLGNPPGKNNSYGDAVNWESLLSRIRDKEDLFFISDDKDFKSPLGSNVFNSFLLQEWTDKKESRLFYYAQLSEFFMEHHTDIKLRVEEEKNQLINELSQSGSFAYTHGVISKLARFDGFSDTQTKQLVDVLMENPQVHWISGDYDVNSFYRSILHGKERIFEDDLLQQLHSLLGIAKEQESNKGLPDSDLPF